MTHFLQRTAILLMTACALGAQPALARTHHHHHVAKKGPAAHRASAADSEGTVITLESGSASYVVKKGDTLGKIADQLDTTVADLKRENKLKSNALQPGQALKGGSATSQKAYVVAHGDTLFSVAKRFQITAAALRDENSLGAKAAIKPGQKLKLPADAKIPASLSEKASPAEAVSGKGRAAAEGKGEDGASRAGAAGRVEEVAGKAAGYKVRKGDTLDKIADKLGTSVAQLKRDNHLKGSAIRPGQHLKGGKGAASRVYVAASGDTLAGISTRFGVSVQALKSANGVGKRRNLAIKGGQRIHLPSDARDHGRSEVLDRALMGAPRPSDGDAGAGLPTRPQPYLPPGGAGASRPGIAPPVKPQAVTGPSDVQVSQMGRGRFQWPLKGEIISDFGPKDGGQRNDGINIRAGTGDPIRAAADGDVVYAGDQVPGFGNLVLIKHADGWVTAYGHLAHVDVKMQQKIAQGQTIGQAGQTGGVTETQLHFEVRYAPNPGQDRARPVDPKLVLPK